jgi:hypothetical protein
VALSVLAVAPAARAGGPFDGLWVDDLATQADPGHADVYLVADGRYRCDSCIPPRAYAADGKDHPVPGDCDTLSESVTVTGPRSIVTRIVGTDMVRETTMTVAPDDSTATYVSLDRWPGRTDLLKTEFLARRVAPAPAGAHPVSGSWLGVRYIDVPVPYRSVEFSQDGDRLTRSTFRHGHYTAVLGGPPVVLRGAAGDRLTVTVRQADARTLVETVLSEGKPATERTYRLSADGKALETTVHSFAGDRMFTITAHRGH